MALIPALGLTGASTAGCTSSEPEPESEPEPVRVYYVSPHGDDAASGLTHESPWRTITHVNAQLANGEIGPYDTVLFQCGSTLYGKIRPPEVHAANGSSYLTIGSYQTSKSQRRPTISSYKVLNNAAGWKEGDALIWAIDLSDAMANVTHTGYDGAQGGGTNIGFLKVDGIIRGRRVRGLTDLTQQWDFFCSGSVLHVRSMANPAEICNDIRAACDGDCITLRNSMRITGLRLEGSGGHGVQGAASNVRIDDNEFAELGGSLLDDTTRYGNGFQAWIDSANILVERNIFHDIYDVALTAQGGPTSKNGSWSDIAFRNNLVYYCNQSIEFWSDGNADRDRGFIDCVVECNTCLYAGYGWSSTVRPDQNTKVHLLTYSWVLPADITVRHNIFYDGLGAYRFSAGSTPGLVSTNNAIWQRRGVPIQVREGIETFQHEQNSAYFAIPSGTDVDVARALQQVADQRGPGCDPPEPP